MTKEQLSERMMTALRMTDDLSGELGENIDAALEDLERRGVGTGEITHLVAKAVELKLKSEYDWLGKGEQYFRHYVDLSIAMSMAEEYASEAYWSDEE